MKIGQTIQAWISFINQPEQIQQMKQTKNFMKDSKPSDNSSYYQENSRLKNSNSPDQSINLPKQTALDLKKINLHKDPKQSSSSLELLILLLFKSLKLSLQQILGLFTNQNKYLAHIVVKGINENFQGIEQFYRLINQNIDTLLRLYQEDHDDTFACLYAIKPGFISKNQHVSDLVLSVFNHFQDIYPWFVGKQAKCSNTFLLGVRRHQNITGKYATVLFRLIQGHQIQFFSNHYISSIASNHDFIYITTKLVKYIASNYSNSFSNQSNKSKIDLLEQNGVFQRWFQIVLEFYQGPIDDKLMALQFLGEFMLYLPQIVQKNPIVLNSLRHDWVSLKIHTFVPLFNQLLIILQKLANSKSPMAKKLYGTIVGIFNDTYEIEDKRQFIVNGFFSILSQFPDIPSDLFIKNYQLNKLNPNDFLLICEAIDISEDQHSLIKIGQILKQIYFYDVVTNYFVGGIIPEIVKKIIESETKQVLDFIISLFKTILSNYVSYVMKIKAQPKIASDDTYFGKKKHMEKSAQQQKNDSILFNKRAQLTVDLCEKIIDVLIQSELQENYLSTLKNYILITNSEVKRNNFGMGTKRLTNILQKKLKVTKEQQQEFEQQNKQNLSKSGFRLSESLISKKARDVYGAISSLSRVQVPEKVTKQFDQIIAKRKRETQQKTEQQLKKKKEEELKKILYKKQLQKMNLIRGGFGQGQAQLKEEGFWNKFIKEADEIKVYTNDQVEDAHLEAADLIIKKYNKLFKYFFFNYSSTMYSNKVTNFDQNLLRKETLNAVEIIKFLKDYNLIFPTNLQQIQTLVKEINIKILYRKQVVNELDYEGFQQFIRQFCLCIWNKNQRMLGPQQYSIKMDHLTLPQILLNLLDHLKNVFKSKGQNLSFFDIAQSDSENISNDIIQLNEKLKDNQNYILPKGYKKITDKKINFKPLVKETFNLTEKFNVAFEILDQIIFSNLNFHIIQPHSEKVVKTTAKPFHHINVKDRDPTKIKTRALSTIIDRKTASHTSLVNNLTKNDLSKGIKKAMLLLKNQDKIVGQQVAFVLEGMLTQISRQNEKQIPLLNKLKVLNKSGQVQKRRGLSHRKVQSLQQISVQKVGKTINLNKDYEKIKNEMMIKRQHKLDEQKKKEEEMQERQRKKKQQQQKYYQELKQKVEQKKKIQQQQQAKRKQKQQLKEQKKAVKQKFEDFNSRKVDKLKKQFEEISSKKKKEEEEKEIQNQELQQKRKKIRSKIESQDKIITQIRKQTLEAIVQISFSENFKNLTKQFQTPLKTIFQYMEKLGSDPLALKKCRSGEIDCDTWIKFNKIFQISPLIVTSKDVIGIFKAVTKDKRVSKDFLVGLTYDQFLQCLLRQCIKQKSIFSKISQHIKDDKSTFPIDGKNKKQIPSTTKVQLKNQFEEQEELDVKKLLKEPDVRSDIIDHYGDVSKFNVDCFKGLIYYLRMPFTKKGQDKRIKELVQMQNKPQVIVSNIQKLKDKLKAQYTLQRTQPQKKQQKNQTKLQSKESKQQKIETKSIKGQTKPKIEKEQVKSKKSQKK